MERLMEYVRVKKQNMNIFEILDIIRGEYTVPEEIAYTEMVENIILASKYRMDIYIDGKTVPLGIFDTEEKAKLEFIKHKEAAIVTKADLYRDKIPARLYKAMLDFKVELSDWN